MTVQELIDSLESYDPNTVVVCERNSGYVSLDLVEHKTDVSYSDYEHNGGEESTVSEAIVLG